MIGWLSGTTQHVDEDFIILNVSGVGYKVYLSGETIKQVARGDDCQLWVYHSIRDDASDLYGFLENKEREFFELLLSISGIGPKSALGILSIAPVDKLSEAIAAGDTSYLTEVSGIGTKSANKIILELEDKLPALEDMSATSRRAESDTLEALTSMGYSRDNARAALREVDEVEGTSEKLREALKILGQAK